MHEKRGHGVGVVSVFVCGAFIALAAAQTCGWRDVSISPIARFGCDLAYDTDRGVTVMFGGETANALGVPLGDTYEWDGASWQLRATNGPSPRGGPMAFHAATHRTIQFGAPYSNLQDTWAWDGTVWTQLPIAGPLAAGAMAYDEARQVIVQFGGFSTNHGYRAETWEFDGATWTQRAAGGLVAPSARSGHRLVYDRARGKTVLFGGETSHAGGTTYVQDTWEWDGTAWTNLTAGVAPPADATLYYDDANHRTVAVGNASGTNFLGEYYWDGASWAPGPITPMSERSGMASTYDRARGRAVLFGGYLGYSYTSATWERAAAGWQRVYESGPAAQDGVAECYDSDRHVTVVAGGLADYGTFETWEWDGAAWQRRALGGPAHRAEAAMAYDSNRHRCVMFGGGYSGSGLLLGDTWEWDGNAWSQVSSSGPAARSRHTMAFDSNRNVVVMIGADFERYAWEWDGATWTRGPNASTYLGYGLLAYDSVRRRCVYFSESGQTWEYNGASWTRRFPNLAPVGRSGGGMAYDTVNRVCVLYGGYYAGYSIEDVYSYNGVDWTLQPLSPNPGQRDGLGFAFDSARGVVVMHGGDRSYRAFGDTWELKLELPTITQQPAAVSVCTGSPFALTVVAAGTGPHSYQWTRGGANVPGATSATYYVNSATVNDNGAYQCIVQQPCGTRWSNSASVSIRSRPSITTHPTDQYVCPGAEVTLIASATGDPLTYQWERDGSPIPGAVSNSLILPSVTLASDASYRAQVSNSCGSTYTNDARVHVGRRGDSNCDGNVNNFDIDSFVLAIMNSASAAAPTEYLSLGIPQACWDRRTCWADVDRSGAINNFDIDSFVSCVLHAPPAGGQCP